MRAAQTQAVSPLIHFSAQPGITQCDIGGLCSENKKVVSPKYTDGSDCVDKRQETLQQTDGALSFRKLSSLLSGFLNTATP